jgi:hypothetical protein
VHILEDAAGAVEAGQERSAPPAFPGGQALAGREILRALAQVLDAQQLAADRTGEKVLAGGRAARCQAREQAGRLERRDGVGLRRREGKGAPRSGVSG